MPSSSPDAPKAPARPSIRDVAHAAGTAVSTVSRALNGHPDVSPEKRRRILAIAEELGYRQNAFARSLISGRSSLVAVVANEFNSFNSEYHTQLLQGVAGVARQHHLELLLSFPSAVGEVLAGCTSIHRRGIADGALVISPTADDEKGLRQLQRAGFSVVVINPARRLPGLSSIEPANVEGAFAATRHLLDLGHRRIGVVAFLTEYSYGRDRIEGYKAALREAGIPLDARLVATGLPVKAVIGRWLDSDLLPTGIVCFNDGTAYAAISELATRNLAVPQDISVVGFGDLPHSEYFGPGLTTMRQPIEEIGRQAMQMLADLIAGMAQPGTYMRLSTQLVIRGSTGPPGSK